MNFKLSKEQEFVRKMVREFPDADFTVLHHGDKCGCNECIRKRMENKPIYFYNIFEGRWIVLKPSRTNLAPKKPPAIEIEANDDEIIGLVKGLIKKTGISRITISFNK